MYARYFQILPLIIVAFFVTACGDDSPGRMGNPMGPGPITGQPTPGTMGPGMGMAAVAGEFDYLAQMIPHHEEAVATARLLARGTERQEMRDFAATIIRTQTAEIEQMKTWLAAWYPGRDARVSYVPMMRDLTALTGSALDRAFLEDMIPHHMMAVMMSQQLVMGRFERHAEVVPFAQNIRDVQQSEIHMMRQWLDVWW